MHEGLPAAGTFWAIMKRKHAVRIVSNECWGCIVRGGDAHLCTPGFVIGINHFKNKFCPACHDNGMKVDAERLRVTLPNTPITGNGTTEGFWNASPCYGGRFRVINQTAKCTPPSFVLLEDPDSGMASLPFLTRVQPHYIDEDGLVNVFVCNGTLIPHPPGHAERSRKRASLSRAPSDGVLKLEDERTCKSLVCSIEKTTQHTEAAPMSALAREAAQQIRRLAADGTVGHWPDPGGAYAAMATVVGKSSSTMMPMSTATSVAQLKDAVSRARLLSASLLAHPTSHEQREALQSQLSSYDRHLSIIDWWALADRSIEPCATSSNNDPLTAALAAMAQRQPFIPPNVMSSATTATPVEAITDLMPLATEPLATDPLATHPLPHAKRPMLESARPTPVGITEAVMIGTSSLSQPQLEGTHLLELSSAEAARRYDVLAGYGDHGSCVDLFAPASHILGAVPSHSSTHLSGTSMATSVTTYPWPYVCQSSLPPSPPSPSARHSATSTQVISSSISSAPLKGVLSSAQSKSVPSSAPSKGVVSGVASSREGSPSSVLQHALHSLPVPEESLPQLVSSSLVLGGAVLLAALCIAWCLTESNKKAESPTNGGGYVAPQLVTTLAVLLAVFYLIVPVSWHAPLVGDERVPLLPYMASGSVAISPLIFLADDLRHTPAEIEEFLHRNWESGSLVLILACAHACSGATIALLPIPSHHASLSIGLVAILTSVRHAYCSAVAGDWELNAHIVIAKGMSYALGYLAGLSLSRYLTTLLDRPSAV